MRREEKTGLETYLSGHKCARTINGFVVHCSATKPGQKVNVAVIDKWHSKRGFRVQRESGHSCGYHFVILEDGTIEIGRFLNEVGAHVQGYNSKTIGICYVGGLDAAGKPKDTRTDAQKDSLRWLLTKLKQRFPQATIAGHRDYSPDRNGNGIIEPREWLKACPCFDAKMEYSDI